MRVAVTGASGFVGSAICEALERRGHEVVPVAAPRLRMALSPEDYYWRAAQVVRDAADEETDAVRRLADDMTGVDAVVNAAGIADAACGDEPEMFGANALLPEVVRRATEKVGAIRFVHVSSAGVQGSNGPWDESMTHRAFSVYTMSKAAGELAVGRQPGVVVYRPTSVQGETREVTARLVRMARSRFASVAGDGSQTSPQCLVENVGDAAAFLATTDQAPRAIVLHPSEGVSTASLLTALGGRPPRRVPRRVARAVVAVAYAAERAAGRQSANARRLELMWFGQYMAASWLTSAGWTPVVGAEGWSTLAERVTKREGYWGS